MEGAAAAALPNGDGIDDDALPDDILTAGAATCLTAQLRGCLRGDHPLPSNERLWALLLDWLTDVTDHLYLNDGKGRDPADLDICAVMLRAVLQGTVANESPRNATSKIQKRIGIVVTRMIPLLDFQDLELRFHCLQVSHFVSCAITIPRFISLSRRLCYAHLTGFFLSIRHCGSFS